MNPAGAAILLVLLIVVFAGSRLAALLAMAASVLYLTQHQQLMVAGVNCFAIRFIEMAGFARVMMRGELSFRRLNGIDKAFILLYVYAAVVYCMRATEGQVYIIGNSVDAFLCYFSVRGLIRDADDFKAFLHSFLLLLAPYTALVIFESVTHHNPFAFIGGGMWDWMRNGRLRCVGTFRNPDLLGTLGATFFPLYVARACVKEHRKRAIFGIMCCAILVYACNSGGPVSATGAALVGWFLWRLRGRMQLFRRGLVIGIVLADMIMKAPVWYLIARVSELTGGDGWHRAYLMDVTFQHFGKWWVAGLPMTDTIEWFPYAFVTGADITNQYISFGLNSGIGAVLLFILVLKRCYSNLSAALEAVRSRFAEVSEDEYLLWGMGAMLGAHIINWFGITYFDQFYMIYYMQLAAIASVTVGCIEAEPVAAPEGELALEPMGNTEPVPHMEHEST